MYTCTSTSTLKFAADTVELETLYPWRSQVMVAHGCKLHVVFWVSWMRWIRVFQWGSRPKQCSGGSIHSHSCGMRRSAFEARWVMRYHRDFVSSKVQVLIEKPRILKSCAFYLWFMICWSNVSTASRSFWKRHLIQPGRMRTLTFSAKFVKHRQPCLFSESASHRRNLRLFPPEGIRGSPDWPSCLGGFMTRNRQP